MEMEAMNCAEDICIFINARMNWNLIKNVSDCCRKFVITTFFVQTGPFLPMDWSPEHPFLIARGFSIICLLTHPFDIIPNTINVKSIYCGKAFDDDTYLPKEILWRKKEAFSDGVSSLQKSWYEIIGDYVQNMPKEEELDTTAINKPTTPEQVYYMSIFQHSL